MKTGYHDHAGIGGDYRALAAADVRGTPRVRMVTTAAIAAYSNIDYPQNVIS